MRGVAVRRAVMSMPADRHQSAAAVLAHLDKREGAAWQAQRVVRQVCWAVPLPPGPLPCPVGIDTAPHPIPPYIAGRVWAATTNRVSVHHRSSERSSLHATCPTLVHT
jgi:hypothetical protein